MKRVRNGMLVRAGAVLAAGLYCIFLSGCFCAGSRNSIYQYSTMGVLSEGLYDGTMDCRRLLKHGDCGIGTFNGLEGEMIVLDGRIYQVKSDGLPREVKSGDKLIPLAVVTFFSADKVAVIEKAASLKEFGDHLDSSVLPTKNIFYFFKLKGEFPYMKLRSIPKQKKPYPSLVEAAKEQSVFEFKNISGTLIGVRFPEHSGGLNMPGYHMHFLSSDKKHGGHVLDCSFGKMDVLIDEVYDLTLELPRTEEFLSLKVSAASTTAAAKAEK